MRPRVRDAPCKLVPADTGENCPIPSFADGVCAFCIQRPSRPKSSGQWAKLCACKRLWGSPKPTAINVDARPSTLCLDLPKVRPVFSAGLGLVVVRKGVEARGFGALFRQNVVCHADDRGGIKTAA